MNQLQFLNNLATVIIDGNGNEDLNYFATNVLCPKEIKIAIEEGQTNKSILYLTGIINYKNNGIAAVAYTIKRIKN